MPMITLIWMNSHVPQLRGRLLGMLGKNMKKYTLTIEKTPILPTSPRRTQGQFTPVMLI